MEVQRTPALTLRRPGILDVPVPPAQVGDEVVEPGDYYREALPVGAQDPANLSHAYSIPRR